MRKNQEVEYLFELKLSDLVLPLGGLELAEYYWADRRDSLRYGEHY